MFVRMLQGLLGTRDNRYLVKLNPILAKINDYESSMSELSDADLQNKTTKFREQLQNGHSLDDILPEAFALVREASKRVLQLRHYDVQMMGGIVLHRGAVAEMATGEGKTLVATLPVYLNALEGKGVHVVTVNDYLAKRDSEWMGEIYRFLGLSVGCIINDMSDDERKKAYNCDVTYATNNELGFDYLRDNMKFHSDEVAQRDFNYAIVDEVDSILIDEARTPLIISGPTNDSSKLYEKINQVIPKLPESYYEKDEKNKSITLTEEGNTEIEQLLKESNILQEGSLYELQNIALVHHVNQALRAHKMYQKDVDYMINNNQVIIIDEFTGRMMEGRRYSEGLHQALEAKEKVTVQMENQTLASITFQNYFRLYKKLSGMTGTAKTEAIELMDIYNLDVVQVNTNLPIIRQDEDDEIYRTEKEKIISIITLIKECNKKQQPVLVGTTSVEKSEQLSEFLQKEKIKHKILNARFHEQEAGIIAQAGSLGAVTVATNMAGRGTDIKLGGNLESILEQELNNVQDEHEIKNITEKTKAKNTEQQEMVKQAGGLCVIGTERHESRRIDNQLRGRSGRQGDPGMSRFFLCLEDDLMRIFGSDKLDSMLKKLGLEEGEAITHPWVNKALERAQKKVEARNYDIRKHLLKYDDVMNEQRKVIYTQRREIMLSEDVSDILTEMIEDVVDGCIETHVPRNSLVDQWRIESLHSDFMRIFGINLPLKQWITENLDVDKLYDKINGEIEKTLNQKIQEIGESLLIIAKKSILLRTLDNFWKEHLLALDHLRQGINLRAMAQRDPLNEYKSEAFMLFEQMLQTVREESIALLFHLQINQEAIDQNEKLLNDYEEHESQNLQYSGPSKQEKKTTANKIIKGEKGIKKRLSELSKKTKDTGNRNALCKCGSGKRYKHCCGNKK